MDLTRQNFEQLFESLLVPAVREADFIALDCEFSGLNPRLDELRSHPFDSVDDRYVSGATSATCFQLLQLGICPVKKHADGFVPIAFDASLFESLGAVCSSRHRSMSICSRTATSSLARRRRRCSFSSPTAST